MNTTKFLLTIPTDLKTRLQEHANEKNLSLTAYVRLILTEQERLIEMPQLTTLTIPKSMPHVNKPVVGFSKNKQVHRGG